MENTARFFAARYQEARALLNTERNDECISILEEMTYDPDLTLWFQLQVHFLLAEAVDEVFPAKEHLATAEIAYAEILQRWPEGTQGQEKLHERLKVFRKDMDDMKREIEEDELLYQEDAEAVEEVQSEIQAESQETTSSKEQDTSQVSSTPTKQVDSQTTVGSPLVDRPTLTPVTSRSRMAHGGGNLSIPLRLTPSRPRPADGFSSPIVKRDLEDDEDDEDMVPMSPTKKKRQDDGEQL